MLDDAPIGEDDNLQIDGESISEVWFSRLLS
jgi:hypothetical protein